MFSLVFFILWSLLLLFNFHTIFHQWGKYPEADIFILAGNIVGTVLFVVSVYLDYREKYNKKEGKMEILKIEEGGLRSKVTYKLELYGEDFMRLGRATDEKIVEELKRRVLDDYIAEHKTEIFAMIADNLDGATLAQALAKKVADEVMNKIMIEKGAKK